MAESPVFNASHGFGEDGDPTGDVVQDYGRCVVDGPFADLRPLFRQTTFSPRCLSRGFCRGMKTGKIFPGNDVRPQKIGKILSREEFDAFSKDLEMGPHNFVPFSIRGDFFSFSSPYGPLSAASKVVATGAKICHRASLLPAPRPVRPSVVALAATRKRSYLRIWHKRHDPRYARYAWSCR